MRRSTKLLIAALSSFSLVGCEDGPNQTYSPAPAGAGDLFNDGKPVPQIDPGQSSLSANFQGKSAQEICSADEKRVAWAKMLAAPIEPPRKYANIDMAGSDNWEGLTVENAEKYPGGNCQAVSDGADATGLLYVHWGDNGEVEFIYDPGTHIVYQMELFQGYSGKMTFKGRQPGGFDCYNYKDSKNVVVDPSCPHKGDVYEIGVGAGNVIKKNGKPFLINWDTVGASDPTALMDANITELYDAAIATFMPTVKPDADCGTSGGCLVLADAGDGTGIFGFRPLAVYVIARQFAAQPVPSTPTTIYNFFVKTEPYSNNPNELKIDAEGPTAKANLGPAPGHDCNVVLGQTYGDFKANCVNISGDPSLDKQNMAKLTGGRTHTFDDIIFNVVGVNNNFTLKKDTFDVVKDNDLPADTDQVTEWIFDVRAKGNTFNDLANTGKLDNHGSGLVYREFARQAQRAIYDAGIAAGKPITPEHKLGDPACFPDAPALPAAGCTGLEGLKLPGIPLGAGTPLKPWDNLDSLLAGFKANGKPKAPYTKSALKPGDIKGGFMTGESGPLWDTVYRQVIKVLGKGDVFNLPYDVQDRRFFFKYYSYALVQYMKAYGAVRAANPGVARVPVTPYDVTNTKLNYENLFFDISDANQFDKIEYVERDFVDATHEPTNFDYGSDPKTGNQRTTQWDRKMNRNERAVYQAMLEDATKPVGLVDNVQITNLFGSPVLAGANGAYPDLATAELSVAAGGLGNDSKGKPLADHYKGAWGNTILHQGNSPIQIFGLIQNYGAAKVRLPQYTNPYDQTSALVQKVEVLVPHFPVQPGMGVPIPLTATRDKLITSGDLDFSGNTSTYHVQYIPQTCSIFPAGTACTGGKTQYQCNPGTTPANADWTADTTCTAVDPKTMDAYCCSGKHADTIQTQEIKVLAITSQDYLGDVFVCQDPNNGDILSTRMYDSAQRVLNWMTTHPASIAACDMVVRYAPFNNYIDKIFARSNGVTLNISKSQNSGRVADATLWDPGLTSQ